MSRAKIVDDLTLTQWAQDLVRHASPQTALFEQEPQIQAFLAGPVAGILDRHGVAWRQDAIGNIIVEFGPADGASSLMLMAYAMTHPVGRMNDAFSGDIVDNGRRIRGRGISEQKAALTAAIAATIAARDLPLKGRLVLTVSAAGETGRHDAAQSILKTLGYVPSAAVIAIGTAGRLALANKGRIDVEVRVRGRASHSSTPWAGIDAINGARKVLDRVLAIDLSAHRHSGLGAATLTATALRSWPEATHTIQDEVHMVFDRRLLPGEDSEAAFEQIAAAADIGEPWHVETIPCAKMFPAEIPADGQLADAIRRGCAIQGLPAPTPFYSDGALDAGLFDTHGAQAAMWGPGDMSLWHTDDESVEINDLVNGAKAYAGLVEAYLC